MPNSCFTLLSFLLYTIPLSLLSFSCFAQVSGTNEVKANIKLRFSARDGTVSETNQTHLHVQ